MSTFGARKGGRQSSLTIALAAAATAGVAFLIWQWTRSETKHDTKDESSSSTGSDLFVKANEPMDSKQPSPKKLSLDDLVIETTTESFSSPPAPPPRAAESVASHNAPAAAASEQLAPDPSSLPTTISRSCVIQSIPTQYWIQLFADRIVLGISQLNGRIGNYLLCQAIRSEVNPKDIDYQVTSLLGAREDTLLSVFAERISDSIMASNQQNQRPIDASSTIVLGISLHKEKGKDPEMFRSLVDLMVQLYEEAITLSAAS